MKYTITVEVEVPDAARVLSLGQQVAEEGGTEINTVGEALGELLVNAPGGLDVADLGCELTRLHVSDGSEPVRETPAVREALQNVLHYTWADEKEEARGYLREHGSLTGHVFADLVALDNWLHGTEHTPESYLADGGEDVPAPPGDMLQGRRQAAADEAFAAHDFGDEIVAEADGWDGGGVEWCCTFYVERHRGPSLKRTFVVRFEPGTAEVEEAYVAE